MAQWHQTRGTRRAASGARHWARPKAGLAGSQPPWASTRAPPAPPPCTPAEGVVNRFPSGTMILAFVQHVVGRNWISTTCCGQARSPDQQDDASQALWLLTLRAQGATITWVATELAGEESRPGHPGARAARKCHSGGELRLAIPRGQRTRRLHIVADHQRHARRRAPRH